MGLQAESYWRSRFAADRDKLAERRRLGLAQAHAAAERLRSRWPGLTGVWLFGSVLGPGFREHSDLDLLAEGLPLKLSSRPSAWPRRPGPCRWTSSGRRIWSCRCASACCASPGSCSRPERKEKAMQDEDLLELRDDLRREGQRLEALARS